MPSQDHMSGIPCSQAFWMENPRRKAWVFQSASMSFLSLTFMAEKLKKDYLQGTHYGCNQVTSLQATASILTSAGFSANLTLVVVGCILEQNCTF